MSSIYFNHIPRTGGTTLSRMFYNSGISTSGLNILNPEVSFFQKKPFNKETVCSSDLIMGHYGTAPLIFNNKIDTITFLRNPVNQVVSMFCKLKYESNRSNTNPPVFDIFRFSEFKNDPATLFREWLYDKRAQDYTNNGQIFNLINTSYPYNYDPITKEKVDKGTQITVTNENAKDVIDSLLFLGNTENLYDGYTSIIDIINKRFGTDLAKVKEAIICNDIDESKHVLSTLNKTEISYILEKNSIDNYYWEKSLNNKK